MLAHFFLLDTIYEISLHAHLKRIQLIVDRLYSSTTNFETHDIQ